MELFIIVLLGVIAAETTYLTMGQLSKATHSRKNLNFVDTSVLIDGRIVVLAEAGFIPGTLAIPRSVVGELQLLADNGDTDKRVRARHGLDIVKELQSITSIKTIIFSDSVRAEEGVDNRLLTLAKRYHGTICTIDYNLNKVAQVEGIQVLNINELAKSLRMAYLPGEKTSIELTQRGNDSHQGVGHLSDGTMVVVENAQKMVGKVVEVEFIRSLQTDAGKMMFARIAGAPHQTPSRGNKQPRRKEEQASQPKEAPRAAQAPVVVQKAVAKPQKQQKKAQQPQQQAQRPPRPAREESQKQPAPKNSSARPSRRRRTPEDSLVGLANN